VSETALPALLERVRHLGYLHTHPGHEDSGLHSGCLELERRGLLRREIDQPTHVCWVCKTVRRQSAS
jgi:hypothetical protein